MKKILITLLSLAVIQISQAQKIYAWMDCGAKVGYGLTGLLNKSLFDDRDYEHHLSSGVSYGVKTGLYFGLFNGITVDAMLSSNKQNFDYLLNSKTYDHSINWKNIDIAVLYRNQKDGVYVELGPQISLLRSVKNADPNNPKTEIKEYFNKNYLSGVFGVGGYLFNSETFTTMLGLRIGYGFGDMVTDAGKAIKYPTPNQKAFSSKPTNAAFAELVLEANFALGYYGRTSCSKRATLFHF